MVPDTNNVFPQNAESSTDAHRWQQFAVLPDAWKNTLHRHPLRTSGSGTLNGFGAGLSCMLVIDQNDRRGNERVTRREIRVDTRERAETVRGSQLGLIPARDIRCAIAVLRRLLQEDAILDERPAGLEPRRQRADPDYGERLATLGAQRRIEPADARFPLVGRATRADEHESGREAAVFHRVRVRQHRY